MYIRKINIYIITALLFLLSGCSEEDQTEYSNQHPILFHISVDEIGGKDAQSRSIDNKDLSKAYYYLLDADNRILKTPFASIAPDISYIRMENLKDGDYQLVVLAESNTGVSDNVTVETLTEVSQKWLIGRNDPVMGLQKEYYYCKHPFSVQDGSISASDIRLSRLVGKLQLNINFNGEVASNGVIQKIEVIPSNGEVYSSVDGNGHFNDSRSFNVQDITKTHELISFPTVEGKPLIGKVKIYASTADGKGIITTHNFSIHIVANKITYLNIDYRHPDDRSNLLYVPYTKFDSSNSAHILQDSEPKSIYYDAGKRSFDVKNPLQFGFDTNNRFYIRFYSAVGISNVKIYWNDGSENLEFARFDTIPPFFEAQLDHPIMKKVGTLTTTDGRMVEKAAIANPKNENLSLFIECDDPYWRKIKTIIPSFDVRFDSYGGNPDASDGGIKGNWMGIRPVHIREACAALTNMAYMVSTSDFVDLITSHDGSYRGNEGQNLSASTIIPQYRSDRSFTVGLVTNVLGLGGGAIWGIYQGGFFYHYTDSHTMWHELGHCVGYSHSSSMTYGNFAHNYCMNLYTKLCKEGRMPVSYSKILNSPNNPNKY